MATSIIVPADFGIENLDCPIHGNITIQLSGYPEILANSLILSYNSPFFLEIFRNQETNTLDMKEYDGATVRKFIEALYTGNIKLEKGLLKGFSKLSSNFKVAWLILHCHNYFNEMLDSLKNTFTDDMFILFEEACHIKLHIGDPVYLKQILDKITSTGHKISDFIGRYMNTDYQKLTMGQVNVLVNINPPEYQVFLRVVYRNLTESQTFDDTSRTVLRQVDLVKSMEIDGPGYEALMDFLLRKLKNITRQDKRIIHGLNSETLKEYKKRHPPDPIIKSKSVSNSARSVKTLKGVGTKTELELIPSKHHLFQCYEIFEDMPLKDFINILALSSEVKNLFMLLEAIDMFGAWDKFNSKSLQKVTECILDRGWSRIPASFLNSLFWLNDSPEKLAMLQKCTELISNQNHTIIISKQTTTPKRFLLEERFYKFPFPRPRTTNCVVLSTHCGTLVKVCPLSRDGEKKFNIQVMKEQGPYTSNNMHFHAQYLKPERMHFVVEMFNEGEDHGVNMEIAWTQGAPDFKEDQIYWGGWHWGDAHMARMVLYYDNSM